MNRMFREMDRAFDQFRSSWPEEFPADDRGVGRPSLEGAGTVEPTATDHGVANVEEMDDEYVFVMDLPGFEKADIDLSFREGVLSVRAHADAEEGAESYRARRSRRVARQVPIAKSIADDEISATYHNGVLEVRLPIVDDEREDDHRIEIE
ncbi:Hsp20/alpha crystallin family protein [Natronococcus sp. A-GB7]|uniref:Hsp20/alpha crystallin family protein n=1 Tax=Natronococcus sp. A-GB7 TaxID=3037649 RepID=UPI00241F7765|nr:Hsp20/alpha crystallin family protein [Natronococcus sp. A-GB7]MDG5819084.1 Hsp20/alpha crystallin family protein [Natronococcus sp. A-GB7]